MSRNCLLRYQEIHRGDYLVSNNGKYKAIFQGDGNFVIYTWEPIWASNTANSDAVRLCMQNDCNLVMYNKAGTARWHTNTHRPSCTSCSLCLTDEGVLVLTMDVKRQCAGKKKGQEDETREKEVKERVVWIDTKTTQVKNKEGKVITILEVGLYND
ncbi:hypothetical protein Q5P01_000935 [Channa striata]|uniref:Bulb-type lectin domain-containing protein n=1 Tax=Channa striata TaxID=64152 RepID=A0AA88IGY8_CHASR|nr:hypothetical protein Q5P01_000935 [Channa striata]